MNKLANMYKILVRAYKDDDSFTDKENYYKKKYIEAIGENNGNNKDS